MTTENGSALKAAEKRARANRDRQAELKRLRREWVGDTQLTREELIKANRDLREDMYRRHPEFRPEDS